MGEKLPSMKPKNVIKILESLGFYQYRQRGSHVIMIKDDSTVYQPVIPLHNKDLKKGTLLSIIRQSGLTKTEFLSLRKKSKRSKKEKLL